MTAALPLPSNLVPSAAAFRLANTSRAGGVSLSGLEQVVASNAARWNAELTFNLLRGSLLKREQTALAMRGFLAGAQGHAGEILVPAFDVYRPRDASARRLSGASAVCMSGSTRLFDGAGFAQPPAVHATIALTVAAGAIDLTLTMTDAWRLRAGHFLGIADRLYMVRAAWQDTATGPQKVRVAPRLRVGAALGDAVQLDRPVCRMRLADDDQGKDLTWDLLRYGTTTLSFVEAW